MSDIAKRIEDLEQRVARYGAPPAGSNIGHVFSAVNQRGVVRFLDGQIGGPASFDGYSGFKFLWTNQP